MTGVYIHIPFCKSRCAYCDFYSTTLLGWREAYVDAVIREWQQRKGEVADYVGTIYIGGGTPSVLTATDIARLLMAIGTEGVREITVECNPGDADMAYYEALRQAGVNRLSIGIQSFGDDTLRLTGRRHTADEAREAVRMARRAGIDNISIDLIYGLPGEDMAQWQYNIEEALALGVEHISCYGLMYEEGTRLTEMLARGEIAEVDEEEQNRMYELLCERLEKAGYHHYEVSNWALPGREAVHNSNYWNRTPYIGIGAGAHSYQQGVRRANPCDIARYIAGDYTPEEEILTEEDIYNEQVMLSLRTDRGVDEGLLEPERVAHYLQRGLMARRDHRIVATRSGIMILNTILSDFIHV